MVGAEGVCGDADRVDVVRGGVAARGEGAVPDPCDRREGGVAGARLREDPVAGLQAFDGDFA